MYAARPVCLLDSYPMPSLKNMVGKGYPNPDSYLCRSPSLVHSSQSLIYFSGATLGCFRDQQRGHFVGTVGELSNSSAEVFFTSPVFMSSSPGSNFGTTILEPPFLPYNGGPNHLTYYLLSFYHRSSLHLVVPRYYHRHPPPIKSDDELQRSVHKDSADVTIVIEDDK